MTPSLHGKLITCVILNGPPGVGKDTLADMLSKHGFAKQEFKAQLYKETAQLFNVDLHEFTRRATHRDLKETTWDELDHISASPLTPRQAMIHTSEHYIKPLKGEAYFGDAAAQACRDAGESFVVFSDGGFSHEMPPIIDLFKNTIIFRLRRPGFDFSNDSRNYLEGYPNTFDIKLVDGKPHQAISKIFEAFSCVSKLAG